MHKVHKATVHSATLKYNTKQDDLPDATKIESFLCSYSENE